MIDGPTAKDVFTTDATGYDDDIVPPEVMTIVAPSGFTIPSDVVVAVGTPPAHDPAVQAPPLATTQSPLTGARPPGELLPLDSTRSALAGHVTLPPPPKPAVADVQSLMSPWASVTVPVRPATLWTGAAAAAAAAKLLMSLALSVTAPVRPATLETGALVRNAAVAVPQSVKSPCVRVTAPVRPATLDTPVEPASKPAVADAQSEIAVCGIDNSGLSPAAT
jgi:hypothetical protein